MSNRRSVQRVDCSQRGVVSIQLIYITFRYVDIVSNNQVLRWMDFLTFGVSDKVQCLNWWKYLIEHLFSLRIRSSEDHDEALLSAGHKMSFIYWASAILVG